MNSLTKNPFQLLSLTFVLLLWGCSDFNSALLSKEGRFEKAASELEAAPNDQKRFYALREAAKSAFDAGELEIAREYAGELLEMAPSYERDWNYGNAIHDGNMVLGRYFLHQGESERAGDLLLEAGRTTGSPQLNSFGPNMSLARDLLEDGESEVVLEYFELCRNFWSSGERSLDRWSRQVEKGNMPRFGANLYY